MSSPIASGLGAACLAVSVSAAAAAPQRLVLDPAATEIRFELPATLHTVEGSAALERGTVVFDPTTGAASGEIVVDARSLETGNRKRDRVMHARVLESEAHSTIVFVPERLEGSLAEAGVSRIRLHGELRIHGEVHPTAISAEVRTDEGSLTATGRFSVPYVALGMEDPSRLVLRVAKEVEIELRFTAPLLRQPASAERGARAGAPSSRRQARARSRDGRARTARRARLRARARAVAEARP